MIQRDDGSTLDIILIRFSVQRQMIAFEIDVKVTGEHYGIFLCPQHSP